MLNLRGQGKTRCHRTRTGACLRRIARLAVRVPVPRQECASQGSLLRAAVAGQPHASTNTEACS